MIFEVLEEDGSDYGYNYNLSQEEDIFFQLDDGKVVNVTIVSDTNGFASCEKDHGCLNYMIEQSLDITEQFGSFVIAGCTGEYFRGGGWTTDDDAEFYAGIMRKATKEEIEAYGDEELS